MKKVVAFVLSALLICTMSVVAFAAEITDANRDKAIAEVKAYLADMGVEGDEIDQVVDSLDNAQLTAISEAETELKAEAETLKADIDKATTVTEIQALVKKAETIMKDNGVEGIAITDVKVTLTTVDGKTVATIAPSIKVKDNAPVAVDATVTSDNEIKNDVENKTPVVDEEKNPINNDSKNPVKPAGSEGVVVLVVSALAVVAVLGLAIHKKHSIV
ncbi:MAG: hypothetical protein HFJ85_04705 [Oscillospiraceae bacterium]|nr:hypothetical protein [Oscillospiraceae bacterium]